MFVQRLMRLDKLSEPRVQSVVKLQLEVSPFLCFCRSNSSNGSVYYGW